ncbi:MAG: hypothetical protein KC425_11960 [Anaerolineales bacterium]|nr:hypothetical protein [Anaerolineales bacterium]
MSNLEIGRILRASTTGFAVGCRVGQLQAPAFGSLVKAQPVDAREAIYGLIYDMHVDDDPLVRRLVLAETPSEALINDQRENRMLPIEMSVLAIGYQQGGDVRHGLPPRPPLNLDPVQLLQDPAEIRAVTARHGYLRLVLRAADSGVPVEQLLVAHVRDVYTRRGGDQAWVTAVIHELIALLRSDYEVLVPTLEALSDAVDLRF